MKSVFLGYEINKQISFGKGVVRVKKGPLCIVYIIPPHNSLYASEVDLSLFDI